ncbi:efflux RND transporter periplasmic adaptor subunit [Thiomicrorhabdus aquaedulcis]|uniref:efflux RND transporter periplasmic adaptor subunit n=1 Tax=Thiomicrorhabdus aquaedulcis TaxID=2211106 RepID=UPI000FD9E344|nr:efflux RND transporter periplasmic adaptor subunit [Thiomicrorhabdus aquaedulcis]
MRFKHAVTNGFTLFIKGMFLTTLVLSLHGCEEPTSQAVDKLVLVVKTMQVQSQANATLPTLSGIVVARYSPDMAFRVSGKVVQRLVNVGDVVAANSPLMRLDPQDYQLALQVAMANIKATQSELSLANNEYSRLKTLFKRNLVSQQAVEQAQNQVSVLESHLKSQRLQEQQAQNQLNYTTLSSPGLANVVAVNAEPGTVVTVGQTVVRLALQGHHEVAVQVPESRLKDLPKTAKVTLYGQTQVYDAQLRELATVANPLSRTWEARFSLLALNEAQASLLSLGQTATLHFDSVIQSSASQSTLQVPSTALYEQGDFSSIWVVQDGHVTRKAVKVQALSAESAWISPLEGDFKGVNSIVILGVHLLTEGQAVKEQAR